MARKLSPIEALARDICWAGFSNPKKVTKYSKSEYWEKCSADAKGDYIKTATHTMWLAQRLGIERIGKALTDYEARS